MFGFGKNKDSRENDPERVRQDVKYGRKVVAEKRSNDRMLAEREKIRYELSGKKERDDKRRAQYERFKGFAKGASRAGSRVGAGLAKVAGSNRKQPKQRTGKQSRKSIPLGNRPQPNAYVSPLFNNASSRNPLLEVMERDQKKKGGSGSALFDDLTRR